MMAAEGSNKLLPTARRKGHREVVERQDREGRRCRMPEMWGGRADSGSHSVPLWESQKGEGRKGKERLGKGKRDEVG